MPAIDPDELQSVLDILCEQVPPPGAYDGVFQRYKALMEDMSASELLDAERRLRDADQVPLANITKAMRKHWAREEPAEEPDEAEKASANHLAEKLQDVAKELADPSALTDEVRRAVTKDALAALGLPDMAEQLVENQRLQTQLATLRSELQAVQADLERTKAAESRARREQADSARAYLARSGLAAGDTRVVVSGLMEVAVGTWGPECTIAQAAAQAVREAEQRFRRAAEIDKQLRFKGVTASRIVFEAVSKS